MSTSYPIEIDCLEIEVSEGRCHNSQPPRTTLTLSRSTMTHPNIIQYNTGIFLLKILRPIPFSISCNIQRLNKSSKLLVTPHESVFFRSISLTFKTWLMSVLTGQPFQVWPFCHPKKGKMHLFQKLYWRKPIPKDDFLDLGLVRPTGLCRSAQVGLWPRASLPPPTHRAAYPSLNRLKLS